jgi:uncharacterized membrane protein
MPFWTFLHIVSMFAAVSLTVGGELFALEAGRRRDVAALRAYFRISGRLETLSTVALVAGIVFGLVAASVGGLDLLQGWLVLAYLLVATGFVLGLAGSPYFGRMRAAADASADDHPSPELDRMLASPVPYLLVGGSILVLVVIIWVMVVKPSL